MILAERFHDIDTFDAAIPAVRGGIVARRGLFERLGRAARVTQISAPAGSGKTYLLQSWIAESGLVDSAAWVPVQAADPDPQQFWISVLDALRETIAGSKLIRPLTGAPDLNGWAVIERLLEDLEPLEDSLWLVIDDVHELSSGEALAQLELLMMSAPTELRFVLITRKEVRLGLHRLRLEGELTEIRAADLQFSVDEARALFEAAGVELPESALAALVRRTEGWAAGLRLAALSLAGHPDPERFAAEFSGSERTVAQYLLAEVLDHQSEPVRRLLLRTSVCERVSGDLADRLTGEPGGERIFQDLEDAGAFVVSLDGRRSWFRYHTLFADLLQMELRRTEPTELAALLGAAAGWYAEHGYPVEAVRHAQAARDWDLAARPLSDHFLGLTLDGQGATAHASTEAPDAGPSLDADTRAQALITLGTAELWALHAEQAERHLEQGSALARQIGRPWLEVAALAHGGWATSFRSFALAAQRYTQAIELAREHGWTGEPVAAVAYTGLGAIRVWQMRLEEADGLLDQAEHALRGEVEPAAGVVLHQARGMLALARGDDGGALAAFRTAERLAGLLVAAHPRSTPMRAHMRQTLVRLGEAGQVGQALAGLDETERGEMRNALAAFRLAQGDPEAATAALAPVLDGSAPVTNLGWASQAFVLEAIAREALGDPVAAGRALEQALDLVEPDGAVFAFVLHPAPELLRRHARRGTSHAALIGEILSLLSGGGPGGIGGAQPRMSRAGLGGIVPPGVRGPLSESEARVLRFLPTNLSAPEISGQLYVSVNTVRTHMRHVYEKLGAHSRAEAVDRARAIGLLAKRW